MSTGTGSNNSFLVIPSSEKGNETNRRQSRSLVHTFATACACTFVGFLHWTAISRLFSSVYWHVLNVNNLGFDIQYLLGMVLAFLVFPLVPFCSKRCIGFCKTPLAATVFRALLLSFLILSTMINESVRTFFSGAAAASGLLLLVFWREPYTRWGFFMGLSLMTAVRWVNSSLHPIDLVELWYVPVLITVVGAVSIAYLQAAEGSRPRVDAAVDNSRPPWWKIAAAVVVASSGTMLVAIFLTSDVALVRWAGLTSVGVGWLVVLSIGLGTLVAIGVEPLRQRWVRMVVFIVSNLLVLVGGIVLMFAVRHAPASSFAAGVFLALGVFSPLDWALQQIQNSVREPSLKDRCCVSSALFAMGLWMLASHIFQLSFYAGSMVPGIGSAFHANIPLLMGIQVVPFVLGACCAVTDEAMSLRELKKQSQLAERHTSIEDTEQREIQYALNDSSKAIAKNTTKAASMKGIGPFSLVEVVIWILFMIPGARLRTWNYAWRSFTDYSPQFSVMTWNIQMGYSYRGAYLGHTSLLKEIEIIKRLRPHVVGLQEVDSANMLVQNRDVPGYLADHLGMDAWYGPPPWRCTPGQAILSARPMSNKDYFMFPEGSSPLNRAMSLARINVTDEKTNQKKEVIILNAHITTFDDDGRRRQIDLMRDHINKLPNGPLILMGDMNAPPVETKPLWHGPDAPLKLLTFSQDPLDTASLPPTETFGNTHIDHIYYRSLCPIDSCKRIIPVEGMSDHMPVYACFELGDCPP